MKNNAELVALVMGSQSDWEVMAGAKDVLDLLGIPYMKKILSAHRTPQEMIDFGLLAKEKGFQVIIAGAGGAAHLPGMLAAVCPLPVIGVPINATSLNGLDSLLSIVQMPKGCPVATVAINGAENAAWIAARVLALLDRDIAGKLEEFRQNQRQKVSRQTLD